jgi:hypothetical protein
MDGYCRCFFEVAGSPTKLRDTSDFDLSALEPDRHFWLRFVVSHISQKTSEIWGTPSFVAH